MIFEAALTPNPVDAVAELLRQNQSLRMVVVTPGADEELTLELFRRGAHGIVSREVEPEMHGGVPAQSGCGRNLARQSGQCTGSWKHSAIKATGPQDRDRKCNSLLKRH